MHKVSIIIPVYNCEKSLNMCVSSVLRQSYKNIECILINDGSVDNSGKICDEFKSKDNRVKVIHNKNKGASTARNIGIRESTGEYIFFLDSDDTMNIYMVEEMLISNKNNSDLVICGYNRILKNKKIEILPLSNEGYKYYTTTHYFANDFCRYFNSGVMHAVWNKMYVSKIIKQNNLFFDKRCTVGEDMIFNINYLNCINSITIINKALYNYLVDENNNSLSLKFVPERLSIQHDMYGHIIKFLDKCGGLTKENLHFIKLSYSNSIIGCVENYLTNINADINKKFGYLKEFIEQDKNINNIYISKEVAINRRILGQLLIRKKIYTILMYIWLKKITLNRR